MLKNGKVPSGLRRLREFVARGSSPTKPRIVLPSYRRSSPGRYLAVAAIFRNEAPYLAEWLEFHRLVGVEHVYLYDNGSTDSPQDVLAPFVEERFVTVLPWNFPYYAGSVSAQSLAYAHAIMSFGPDWRWMAFIDLDEFLFPVIGSSLAEVLREFEDLPALAAFWTMFGFSGHDMRPAGLVIESYTMCAPFPTYAMPKSIVNPAEVVGVSNPHLFDLSIGPRRAFTETRQLFEKREGYRGEGAGPRVAGSLLRLNHYYTRSRDEFEEKVSKRNAVGGQGEKRRVIASEIEAAPIRDETILRFVPALKARLHPSIPRS